MSRQHCAYSQLTCSCHYTTKDLYCATLAGVLLVVRDYRQVLSGRTEEERWNALQERTIWLAFGERQDSGFSHLTTFRDRVSFAAVSLSK